MPGSRAIPHLGTCRRQSPPTSLLPLRFDGLDLNLLQKLASLWHGLLARRKLVRAQNIGQNLCVRFAAQASGSVLRHGATRAVEQVAHAEGVPVGEKRTARQRWG